MFIQAAVDDWLTIALPLAISGTQARVMTTAPSMLTLMTLFKYPRSTLISGLKSSLPNSAALLTR